MADGLITKWLLDALVFLRSIRRVFFLNVNGKLNFSRVQSKNSTNQKSDQFKPVLEPRNVGCIRTLEALNNADFALSMLHDGEPFTLAESIRKIVKRYSF